MRSLEICNLCVAPLAQIFDIFSWYISLTIVSSINHAGFASQPKPWTWLNKD